MNLRLVKASEELREPIVEMLREWKATGEKIVPWAIQKTDPGDFTAYRESLEVKEGRHGLVPDSTFFCVDEDRQKIVGAVNIRHRLNERLLRSGGHIGDGVRPSERGRGIATAMIALALEECRKLGIARVLMVCDKQNVASARSIVKNGGVLENEIRNGDEVLQRYWIDLR